MVVFIDVVLKAFLICLLLLEIMLNSSLSLLPVDICQNLIRSMLLNTDISHKLSPSRERFNFSLNHSLLYIEPYRR